jgi:hypothetical protein
MAREIFDSNPDPTQQFNEKLAGWGTRDEGGLPLGNVLGHSLNRVTVCYAILEAAKIAAEFDQLPGDSEFITAGAAVQDRKGTREYPAAHLAPCSLKVGNPGTAAPLNLHEVYADGISRSFVASLFAKTELVHRLANYADSLCERQKSRGGMADALAQSCMLVTRDRHVRPREVLFERLIPDFQAIASEQIVTISQTLPEEYEPSRIVDPFGRPHDERPSAHSPSPIVDQFGRRYAERPSDTRVHSPSAEAYRANRQTVIQILGVYAGTHSPRMAAMEKAANQLKGVRANEERQAVNRLRRR